MGADGHLPRGVFEGCPNVAFDREDGGRAALVLVGDDVASDLGFCEGVALPGEDYAGGHIPSDGHT